MRITSNPCQVGLDVTAATYRQAKKSAPACRQDPRA